MIPKSFLWLLAGWVFSCWISVPSPVRSAARGGISNLVAGVAGAARAVVHSFTPTAKKKFENARKELEK